MSKFDFTISARVYCRDGKFGKLVKVVVEPKTLQVKGLIVEKGFLSKRLRVFPVSLVSLATGDAVHLQLTNDEWANYPAYNEEEYEVLALPWEQRPLPEPEAPTIKTSIQSRDPFESPGGHILTARSQVPLKSAGNVLPLLLFALLTFILAACTGLDVAVEPPAGESMATEEGTAISITPTPSALDCDFLPEIISDGKEGVVVPEGAVIVIRREGGLAGIVESWVVYADGQIAKDNGEQWQVPASLIQNIVASANEIGFYGLASRYIPQDTCCDRFTYSVTIRDCQQIHTVTAVKDAPEVPDDVWTVIRTIEDLLSSKDTAVMALYGIP